MSIGHVGSFTMNTSRNVNDVRRLVKEVLVCLSLFHGFRSQKLMKIGEKVSNWC